jgi:ubiquinone/menaquinone biosynthesis C-methylase UbiE
MRHRLYRLYWKLERILHPTLKFSQYHYYDTLLKAIPDGCQWLELGCGHQMFAAWMNREQAELAARSKRLVGIERDLPALKANPVIHDAVYGDINCLPFSTDCFDVVTANMVVEHMDQPALAVREAHRVLRPRGLFVFHTPNRRSIMMTLARMAPQALKNWLALVLEDREAKDVFPTHYAMNTPREISRQALSAGFIVREIRSVSTTALTALMPPFCIVELLYLRMLDRFPIFAVLRSNLIVTLEKVAPPK